MSLDALNHSASFSGRRQSSGGRIVFAVLVGIKTLTLWSRRSLQRQDLLTLDDRMLSDIGLTRAQAEQEAGKHFWQK